MLNNSFFGKLFAVLFGTVFLISCDSDFNSIGTDIVGDDHFGVTPTSFDVIANSQKTGAVQSNNLTINPLGIFDNGAFGKTTANFVTQLQLKTENPTFIDVAEADIKSVVLNVPYYSTLLSTDSEGKSTYELDSIYGDIKKEIKLKVFENGYYLRDLDPSGDFQTAQKFYSDQNAMFDAAKGIQLNTSETVAQNDKFLFSPAELVTPANTEEDTDEVRAAPGLRLDLNKTFFYNKIFATTASNLVNNNAFKNHFKGLYFQVEEISGGAMALMNFAQGTITVTYKDKTSSTSTTKDATKTLVLNLTGNTVSLLNHTATSLSTKYETLSDTENIYLKGGDGSVAMIDLFGGGNSAELEALREEAISKNWLVNEANIVFYVDQEEMAPVAGNASGTLDPNRIYLYNAKNNIALVDYNFDTSTYASKPKYGKQIFGGIASLSGSTGDSNRKATKYQIRITEHIKNVIFKDSTNVKLGLGVTENIALSTSLSLKNPTTSFTKVPYSSVLNPTGVVLFGNNVLPANAAKKLKLEIYFTKPN